MEIREIIENIETNLSLNNNSLLGGDLGCILLNLEAKHQEKLEKKIEKFLYKNFQYDTYSFCNGIAGGYWLLSYLQQEKNILDKKDIQFMCSEIEFLKKVSLEQLKLGNYDFLHGAVGVAHFLIYSEDSIDMNYFKEFIEILQSQLNAANKIIYRYDQVNHKVQADHVDFGLAHGLPSVIKLLMECHRKGVQKNKVKELSYMMIEFILSNNIRKKQNPNSTAYYPTIVEPEKMMDEYARMGWCYGDLSLAFTLYRAGIEFNDFNLASHAIEVLENLNTISKTEYINVIDAGFCHGSAGISYIFRKLGNYTNNESFRLSSDYWLDQTLKFMEIEDGKVEFKRKSFLNDSGKKDQTMIQGNIGVGLVLNSFITNDFSWDYCFMLND